jgi:hypothetical protein
MSGTMLHFMGARSTGRIQSAPMPLPQYVITRTDKQGRVLPPPTPEELSNVVGISPTGRHKVLCEGCKKYFAAGGGITSHQRHNSKCDPKRKKASTPAAQTLPRLMPHDAATQDLRSMFVGYESLSDDSDSDDDEDPCPGLVDVDSDSGDDEEPSASGGLTGRRGARTRKRYSILTKLKAVKYYRDLQQAEPNKTLIQLQQAVADKFSVAGEASGTSRGHEVGRRRGACAMIGRWVKEYSNPAFVVPKGKKSKLSLSRGPPPRWDTQEKELASEIRALRLKHLKITRHFVMHRMWDMLKKQAVIHEKPSRKWFRNFCRRHSFSVRRATNTRTTAPEVRSSHACAGCCCRLTTSCMTGCVCQDA